VKRAGSLLLSTVLLGVLLVSSARAAWIVSREDRDDVRGRLDLRAVVAKHEDGTTRFRITTYEKLSGSLDPDVGLLEIDIDTNADRKANYVVIVFYQAGSMRGVLYHVSGDLISRRLDAGRVGDRGVAVSVKSALLGSPKSFDFAVFSVWFAKPCTDDDPCVDAIPNRYPLLRMDYSAPFIQFRAPTRLASEPRHPMSFKVGDDPYGIGLAGWKIQVRRLGTATWVAAAEGTIAGSVTRLIQPGGGVWEVRIIAADRRGNATVSRTHEFAMPWDDADPSTTYGGTWTADTGADAYFAETSHAGALGATYQITVPSGNRLCVGGGPTSGPDATATVSIGGNVVGTLTETTSTSKSAAVFCTYSLPWSGDAEVLITVDTAEPVTIDYISITGEPAPPP
jgi:hypothetical protein